VFTKKGLISNIGSYFSLIILLIEIVLMILFIAKGYYKFYYYIKNVIIQDKEENETALKINNLNADNNNIMKGDNFEKVNNGKLEAKRNKININLVNNKDKLHKKRKIRKNFKSINYKNINNSIINRKNIQLTTHSTNPSKREIINNSNFKNKKIIKYNDFEINYCDYMQALKLDKRVYFQYYLSLIKYNQLLIFTFYTSNDYNSKIIKICFFFFLLSLYYTVNSLFFNNSSIHTIYINKGKYDFIYQLPQIIYSSIICSIFKIVALYFSLTEKDVIKVKKSKQEKSGELEKLFKVKFIIFYIYVYILLIIFGYYLACFCFIYKNSQLHVIKDFLTSFLLSLLYPFGICLLPPIFRLISLRTKNPDKEYLYKFSKFLQLI
jgi:hypothetical protein